MPARIAEVLRATRARRPAVVAAVVAVGVFAVGAGITLTEHGARAAVAAEFAERAEPLLQGGRLSVESVRVDGGPSLALLWSPRWNGTVHGTDRNGVPVRIEIDDLARDDGMAGSAAWIVRKSVSSGDLRGVSDTAYAELAHSARDVRVQLAARTEGEDAVIEIYGVWMDERSVPLEDVPADVRDALPPLRYVLPAPAVAALVEDVRFIDADTLNMRLVAYDVPLG